MAAPDPRNHPYRDDLAAAYLQGRVSAPRYAAPARHWVATPTVDLFAKPGDASLASQLVMGEAFDVYDTRDGFSWGQCAADGYVGYVPDASLNPAAAQAPVTITALSAHLYPAPNIKTVPTARLPRGAQIHGQALGEDFIETPQGFLPNAHLAALSGDPVSRAEAYLGVPYLWGGRSSFGLDCSALVQIALTAAGLACPRDSDMQAGLGSAVSGALRRGDLIFWKGHVGIMQSDSQFLHANAHHMAVVSEPLARAEARIASDAGPVTARRRVL